MDFNIYEGMTVTGNAAVTIVRGRVLWENGQLRPEKGYGRHVNRPCFPAYLEAQAKRNAAAKPTSVERVRPARLK